MSRFRISSFALFVSFAVSTGAFSAEKLVLAPNSNVAIIGNTTADRMQHHGWLETYIQALHPDQKLAFRNLGFSGDEVVLRQRSDNFGNADQWLTKVQADVVFAFFGYNESLKGEAGLPGFKSDLAANIDAMRSQKYNGTSAPILVYFSPIAHENLNSPHLPNGEESNKSLALYTQAMAEVCQSKEVRFVDLYSSSAKLYKIAQQPLTMNGIHLLEHGNQAIARVIVSELFNTAVETDGKYLKQLQEAVLERNYYWFSRYRVVDGYNVYGGRSKLAWFNQSNADVMKREMEIFDVMTANRDAAVWAAANGKAIEVNDDNLPKELEVKPNKQGPLEEGKFPYLGGVEAISKFTVAEGMQVNLFASEEMFPELINPVQMAVDTDGRLFASVWPSYPHWNPTEPRLDRIVCLPDEDRDGLADKCVVFADKLNSITGFEFWGGGMLVAAPPEIWFLKDTDGDDKADVKIRMMQGLSSADTHHSANALVIGPDGGLYYSRGIFNKVATETPTKTFRSGASGVYRFDPRTFELEFVFPIGPNPHGDVFDQWGFQFANDGTSGTGSYVNIGKGIGNKQWFKKRVRPVAATGILSSSHFPDANQGNFLICNCIGFLGVLQHEVSYNGADITATEIEPILVSSDPNFRPTDVEIGGDGAIYVSDWANTLIGHMQHNMRDPNRDNQHGRIYRVTYKGRPLVEPVKMKGQPISEVLEVFKRPENGFRYRARLELSGRETDAIVNQVGAWASKLNVDDPIDAQALLECLWVFEEHRVPNISLLNRVYSVSEPRVRAAAIRTLGHWAGDVEEWEDTLNAAARDDSNLVRAEAVKAAVEFQGLVAAEAFFEVASRPTDPELTTILNYGRSNLNVDAIVDDAVKNGVKLSLAAQMYVLRNASVEDLLKMDKTEAVYKAVLSRENANVKQLQQSIIGLAKIQNNQPIDLLLDLIVTRDNEDGAGLDGLGRLLATQPAEQLLAAQGALEELAIDGKSAETRQGAYAAWIAADGTGDEAFLSATVNKDRLQDFLEAVAIVDSDIRPALYGKVSPLISELPAGLSVEEEGSDLRANGIHVDYYYPAKGNVAIETLNTMTPSDSGIVPQIVMNVPQRKEADKFALKFTGMINVPKSGRYTFFIISDDGSRVYINDKQLIDNDGLHGPVEKSAAIDLSAGNHKLVVTYFDNGGGDGLAVTWQGPGFNRQPIAAERLVIGGGETIHDVAIRALGSIPGNEVEKITDLSALIRSGRSRSAAVETLGLIDVKHWPEAEIKPLIDNLVGYLSEMPAQVRAGAIAESAINLTKNLTARLEPADAKAVLDRLQNLDVRVIAIGTVPHRMIYDKEQIAVQAGKAVEFRISNTDKMPHNFVITIPGAMQEIGELAEATGRDPDAMDRHYVPESDKVLVSSKLLQGGETESIVFEVPQEPGIYPYVCTYPGHWRRMYGALHVVANLEEYRQDPAAYLAAHKLEIHDDLLKLSGRSQQWKYDDLIEEVNPLPEGRSFEVGKELFKVASCVACHKLGDEGLVFGPDLAKLDEKKHNVEHILRSLVDPSKDIDDKFKSYSFLLASGKIVTGMVVKETPDEVHVVVNPLAKAAATVIKKGDIDARNASQTSIMPQGLLDKLTQEEILDLIGYVLAKGDKDHKMYEMHKH